MPKATGIYIDDEMATFVKVFAALKGSTVSKVVEDALLRYVSSGGGGGLQRDDMRSDIRRLLDGLKAELGATQVVIETRPESILDEEWCRGSRHLLFAGWTLKNLLSLADDQLRRRIQEGCTLNFLIADPVSALVDWEGRDVKDVLLPSLQKIATLTDLSPKEKLVEVRFHKGSLQFTVSKAIRSSGEVELLVDIHPYECGERLRLRFGSDTEYWSERFAKSVDQLWNDALTESERPWRTWVAQGKITGEVARASA